MKTLCFIIFLIAQINCRSQDSILKITPVNSYKGEIKFFEADNLANTYLVFQNNQIKKYNLKGDSVAVYNDKKRYGNIESVDVTNPLKVLVYFKDYSTIVVLDRMLNVVNTIDLRRENIQMASCIAIAYDNNIWLYDNFDNKLKRINDAGNLLFESTDLRLLFDTVPIPQAIYDRDGLLYLYDQNNGLITFDYYGALKNKLPVTHFKNLQVIDKNTITGRVDNVLKLFRPSANQTYSYQLPSDVKNFTAIHFNGTRFYCLYANKELNIYDVVF